jgi:hypothetical protein
MKVLTFLPRCDLQRRVAKALSSAQFVVETVVSARECLQLTRFAPYEGILVDSDSLIFGDIVLLMKLLRQENSDASLFVFARYLLRLGVGRPPGAFDTAAAGSRRSYRSQRSQCASRR